MESIASLKNAAARAIWGDEQAHQEPISGETGDVSKGEPYDAGNMEPEEVQTKFTAPDETGTQPVEATKITDPTKATDSTEATDSAKVTDLTKAMDSAKLTDATTERQSEPEASPSTNAFEAKDSSIVKGDSSKGQNDVRDPSDPSAHHEKAETKTNVDDSGAGLDLGKNPDKMDGPGPRPLEELAKVHGGDAGKSGSDGSLDRKGDDRSSEEYEGHHDPGTGELYVRSSGLKADGGDFDAAAPGAGREADRLLEEKGLHPNGPATNGSANGHANGSAEHHHKEKTSLKTKIKAKLHRNSATASS